MNLSMLIRNITEYTCNHRFLHHETVLPIQVVDFMSYWLCGWQGKDSLLDRLALFGLTKEDKC